MYLPWSCTYGKLFVSFVMVVYLQDVLVHIRDISHPDAVAQKANVLQTLQQQNVESKLIDNMIEVCNKVDKLAKR